MVTVAHYTDIGGRVAGGNASDSTEIYQEGLRLPPVKLVDAGTPQEGLWRLIERNVRVPRMVLGDLRAQLAACATGVRETEALLRRRYGGGRGGPPAFKAETDALVAYAERFARARLAALPAGTYRFEDALDGDGIDPQAVALRVALTLGGGRLVADFAGSSPQVRGAINCPLPFTRSVVYACVRCLLGQDLPNNGGYFRAIDVLAPPGTIVNPLPPAPVAARGLTGFRIANTVFGALAQVAPERVPACEFGGDTGISLGGYDSRRRPFVYLEFLHGSWGGRQGHDGIDASASVAVNFSNTPIELVEAAYPLRVEQLRLPAGQRGRRDVPRGPGAWSGAALPGSGGDAAGPRRPSALPPLRTRGGAKAGPRGPTTSCPRRQRVGAPAGEDAARRAPGRPLPAHPPRGRGLGPALERDPALVLEDLRQEKITPLHAREAYGVAVREDGAGGWEVDEGETARLRP